MSAPLKVGGYVPKWAPDRTANFQFHIQYPWTVTRNPRCLHANPGFISGTTTWDHYPREWGGMVCCDCGKVLSFGELDPATGDPKG